MNRSQPANFHHPQGFLALAKNVGIKDTTPDLTVIYIRTFHDELLEDGAPPLALLERKMDAWPAAQ
jgi:hypothetical protein